MHEESDREDEALLAQISDGHATLKSSGFKPFFYFLAQGGVRACILLVGAGCLYLSVSSPPGSFAQSFMSNVTAGVGVFVAAAPVLKAIRSKPVLTLLVGLLVAAGLLRAAWLGSTATQPVLLSTGCGVLLLLALDLNVAQWLEAMSRAEGNAKRRLDEARTKVETATTIQDYKYAVHDHLNLPRPDHLGGIRIPEGQTFLGLLGLEDPDGNAQAVQPDTGTGAT